MARLICKEMNDGRESMKIGCVTVVFRRYSLDEAPG